MVINNMKRGKIQQLPLPNIEPKPVTPVKPVKPVKPVVTPDPDKPKRTRSTEKK